MMGRAAIAAGRNCALCALVLMVAVVGCRKERESSESTVYLDETIAKLHPLGWLGGRAHPATRSVEVTDSENEGQSRVTGGMVVADVTEGAPLASAGVMRGDVIVRVGDMWLPNKEDPSLDLIRAVEAEISAGTPSIELRVLRSGKVTTVKLSHGLEPLEIGLPVASERLTDMARSGLDRLAKLQQSDGSFAGAAKNLDDTVTTDAVAGLAFLAGGSRSDSGPHAEAVASCRTRVEAALGDESSELGCWPTAWATMFLAELSGPLDIATPTAASMPATFAMKPGEAGSIKLPGGAAKGSFSFYGDGSSKVKKEGAGDASGGNMVFSTSGGDLPEGFDLEKAMSGGNFKVMTLGPDGVMGLPGGAMTAAPKTEFVEGPAWTIEELEPLVGEGTTKRLQPLASAVKRLVGLQQESGGWETVGVDRGFSETTLATNQALLALGMAQRAGVPVDGEVVRAGLEFVRAATNDGHVFAVDTPGFDRRREAGRSSGAAAALTTLACLETDEFLKELVGYSDRNGAGIPEGGVAVPLHVLNTAILRRQRGASSWATFFEEFKHMLVSLQDPDGSFAQPPVQVDGVSEYDTLCAGEAMRTAIWSLVAALQSDQVPVLTAQAKNPLQPAIASDGSQVVAGGLFGGTPQVMDGEEARQMLERMGVNVDEVLKNSVQTEGG